MSQYELQTKMQVIEKKGLTLKKLRNSLMNLCDNDFNGNNGDFYYIPHENKEGKITMKSRFDAEWDDLVDEFTNPSDKGWDIAEHILCKAYSYNKGYYVSSKIEVVNTSESIIIFIAYLENI